MGINPKIEEEFNNQINEEMFSAYLYLSMSADFEAKNLAGFAQWMKSQAQEEMVHAMKFYQHILFRGGEIKLQTIKEPQQKWSSPEEAFDLYKQNK